MVMCYGNMQLSYQTLQINRRKSCPKRILIVSNMTSSVKPLNNASDKWPVSSNFRYFPPFSIFVSKSDSANSKWVLVTIAGSRRGFDTKAASTSGLRLLSLHFFPTLRKFSWNFCFCFDFESDVSKVMHDQQVFQAVILKNQNFQWNERFSSLFYTNMNKSYYSSN